MTTNSGEHFDLSPPSLLQSSGDGCDNNADGYICSPAAVSGGRVVKVLRDLGCRGQADLWACSVEAAKNACVADASCQSFGVSAKWGLNKAQLFGDVTTKPNPDWSMWLDETLVEQPDVAAVGDPHMTTNSGEHFDLSPPSLLQSSGDGCDNNADGYICSPAAVSGGRVVKVLRDLGCRGQADLWACSVEAAKNACVADASCQAFGVSAKWGLNKAQLFGDVTTK